MNKILSLIICIIFISSCKNNHEGEEKTGLLSNLISITENEDKGIKEILNFYGGRCEYSIGTSASTDKGIKKYFEIKMSESNVLEEYVDKVELPASNIAYLFYKNLDDEKNNYNEIHTVFLFNDGTEKTFKYSSNELELVKQRMNLAYKTVELLNKKDYDNLKLLLNNELVGYNKDELISKIIELEPQFGRIKEFNPYGFRIKEIKNGQSILHISGALIRELQNSEFSIDLDLNSEKEEIYILQYKL